MKRLFVMTALLGTAGHAGAQTSVQHDSLFNHVFPAGNTWTENAADNWLYHADGSGVRKFLFNQSTAPGSYEYFVFRANVAGLFGLAVKSSNSSGQPFYSYSASSGFAMHHYTPGAVSSWTLSLEHSPVLTAYSDGVVEIDGEVEADAYILNSARYSFGWATQFDTTAYTFGGYSFYKIEIPHGATVYQFQATVIDTSASDNVEANLVRFNYLLSESSLASLSTSGTPGQQTLSTSTISNSVVDGENYVYYIKVKSPIGGDGTEFISARYQYYINQL